MVGIPDWDDREHFNEAAGNKHVEKSMRQQRIEICKNCKNLTGFKFCRECHCFMPVKTYFQFFDCPLKKWPKVD